MNFIDESKVQQQIVKPSLEHLDHETIPAAEEAGKVLVEAAGTQAAVIVAGALEGLQSIADRLVENLQHTVAGLDGWTATITIPPFTIQLSKPKGE